MVICFIHGNFGVILLSSVNPEANCRNVCLQYLFIFSHQSMQDVEAEWAGWARAHPIFCLILIEKGRLLAHFLLKVK